MLSLKIAAFFQPSIENSLISREANYYCENIGDAVVKFRIYWPTVRKRRLYPFLENVLR